MYSFCVASGFFGSSACAASNRFMACGQSCLSHGSCACWISVPIRSRSSPDVRVAVAAGGACRRGFRGAGRRQCSRRWDRRRRSVRQVEQPCQRLLALQAGCQRGDRDHAAKHNDGEDDQPEMFRQRRLVAISPVSHRVSGSVRLLAEQQLPYLRFAAEGGSDHQLVLRLQRGGGRWHLALAFADQQRDHGIIGQLQVS
jgi:hypothetical protein